MGLTEWTATESSRVHHPTLVYIVEMPVGGLPEDPHLSNCLAEDPIGGL